MSSTTRRLPERFESGFQKNLTLGDQASLPNTFPTPYATSETPNGRYNPALLLSEEAQDLILSFTRSKYRDAKSDLPAQSTAWAFTLVSRRWLDSGRRALYRAPILPVNTWDRALELQGSLEASPRLASHVRSLPCLPEWIKTFAKSQIKRSNIVAWYFKLIQSCQNLREFPVFIGTMDEAKVVAGAASELVQIDSINVHSLEDFDLSRPLWREFLDHYQEGQRIRGSAPLLDHLRLFGLRWGSTKDTGQTTDYFKSKDLLQPRRLTLTKSKIRMSDVATFTHRKRPRLSEFTATTKGSHLSQSAFRKLVTTLPASLSRLSIECLLRDPPSIMLDEYLLIFYPYNKISIPPLALFSAFTSLTQLRLRGCTGLSLAKITALSSSSPNLLELDFEGSIWALSEIDEAAFDAAFAGFAKLERLHLGTLPVGNDAENVLYDFVADMDERGVECDFDRCEEECEACGGEGCAECDSDYDSEDSFDYSD
ncbi:hypothetical protein P7C70_g2771, partial [Phenoliferia sp. Uapishka_3]